MGQYLHAAYSLRVKDLYDGIKEKKIPNRLAKNDSFAVNRKRITAFVLPMVRKAYREGVDYATVVVKQQLNQDIRKDYGIDAKSKDNLLIEFLARIRAAEGVYNVKTKGHELLMGLLPGPTKRDDPQKEQIWTEYVNGVKSAVNNLFIRAGDEGTMSIYKKIKDV